MPRLVVYLKCDRNVEVHGQDVYLRDMGSLRCADEKVSGRLLGLRVWHFRPGEERRCVISALRLVELMEEVCPDILVQLVGEPDVLVERVEAEAYRGWKQWGKIAMVCMVSFFGTALAIMTYHNDVGIGEVFREIYRVVMNREPGAVNILEVSYSVGLSLGIVVFFNHVGGRRITKDPTPIEVALRNYEEDVDKTLIATASREGKEENV